MGLIEEIWKSGYIATGEMRGNYHELVRGDDVIYVNPDTKLWYGVTNGEKTEMSKLWETSQRGILSPLERADS